jgi:transmembrane sensor
MSNNTIWELIAKKLSGEASLQELVELEVLLRDNPDMHYPIQTVADLWHHATPDTEDAHAAFGAHQERMKQLGINTETQAEAVAGTQAGLRSKTKFLLLSLSFLLLCLAGYQFRSLFFSGTVEKLAAERMVANGDKSEISTRYGSRTKLLLPDSTQVWLNSGSKLTYDKTYGNGTREVSLSGEAYFDVVKNPTHPFVIHTVNIDIKVLGTAFNVKSFPNEKNTETSLIRGSIEVTFKNRPSEKIILKPNEKLITANEEPVKDSAQKEAQQEKSKPATAKEAARQDPLVMVSHLTYEPHDGTIVETSWMENKLIFRSETFEELAIKLERWYGISIRFTDEEIKPRRLTGVFENESLQQALEALQLITPFAYKMNKSEVMISSK